MVWVNAIIQGVLTGGLYALFACGLSLMFGVMKVVNLAHGDLAVVARTLVESPEAWDPAARKFKTPNDFIVSAYRAADAAPETPVEAIAERRHPHPLEL